jgi:hypothetical protein
MHAFCFGCCFCSSIVLTSLLSKRRTLEETLLPVLVTNKYTAEDTVLLLLLLLLVLVLHDVQAIIVRKRGRHEWLGFLVLPKAADDTAHHRRGSAGQFNGATGISHTDGGAGAGAIVENIDNGGWWHIVVAAMLLQIESTLIKETGTGHLLLAH